ncbi:MAG TPA: trigger factor [Candidatus Saccharimonas sp.]|nr:trigger factor [Candidatus Saccharibacteria bacterium]HPQ82492.1 trigger factor [Candidatus Saccharimonas sp.]
MKSTVTTISDTRVSVVISVDKTELADAKQVALKKLSKNTKVPGFRKGHVPLEVVAKHVDPAALAEETLNNAISKSVAEVFLGNQIQVLERPEVEVKKYVPGQELEFTAEADVLPQVKLGDYKKLTAKKIVATVTPDDIEDVVERMRKGFAEKKETKAAAKDGDETVIDFVGKKDGVAFEGGTGTDYPLTLGSNSFIPGFEEALVGLKPGDKKDVELTFPKEYHAKDLAGKKVVFEVTVKKVNAVTLPKVDDEFAAKVGPFTSAKELRDDIKREITAQKEREAGDQLKDDLVKQLVEKSKVSVPAVLREDQIKSIEQDLRQNLMYQGMTLEQYFESKGYADRDAWAKGEAEEAADNRIKAGLVLAELSKELKIEATTDELAEHINQYKQSYANNPDMAKRFDEPEVQREVANRLITEKTVDELVKLNTVKK